MEGACLIFMQDSNPHSRIKQRGQRSYIAVKQMQNEIHDPHLYRCNNCLSQESIIKLHELHAT